MTAYYNENDRYAAEWLRNLIAAGHIAPGDVDERSILDVRPDDLAGYTQCHFFAGIGGWSYAARLAGWSDDRPLWTGSCPCQPFSAAGKGKAQADSRHLWPVFFELIRACQPDVVMGEQVAAAVGKDWLDGVSADLEGIGYTCGAAVVPACAVDAPHRRDRLWLVADAERGQRYGRANQSKRRQEGGEASRRLGEGTRCSAMDDAFRARLEGHARHGDGRSERPEAARPVASTGGALSNADELGTCPQWIQRSGKLAGIGSNSGHRTWVGAEWATGSDGKARRVEPGIRLLAHGVPARVGRLRAYGNAIVPQVAAEVIGAYLDIAA